MNKWFDEQGRVYIYFTLEDASEMMQISPGKAVKLFAELDTVKGVGLIERKKQGQGRPTIIYLKNFTSADNPEEPPAEKENPDLQNLQVKTSQKCKPRLSKNDNADLQNLTGNYTEYNKTEKNNQSIIEGAADEAAPFPMPANTTEEAIDDYRDIIKANIEYDLLCQRYQTDKKILDELVELIVCTAISNKPHIRIGKDAYPTGYVRKQLLSLDSGHVEYVLDALRKNTAKVYNIKAYLLATLFNAPLTIENYYNAEVQHDLCGGKGA